MPPICPFKHSLQWLKSPTSTDESERIGASKSGGSCSCAMSLSSRRALKTFTNVALPFASFCAMRLKCGEIGLARSPGNARLRFLSSEEPALRQQLVLELEDRTLRWPERSAPAFKEDFGNVWGAVDKDVAIAILATTAKL